MTVRLKNSFNKGGEAFPSVFFSSTLQTSESSHTCILAIKAGWHLHIALNAPHLCWNLHLRSWVCFPQRGAHCASPITGAPRADSTEPGPSFSGVTQSPAHNLPCPLPVRRHYLPQGAALIPAAAQQLAVLRCGLLGRGAGSRRGRIHRSTTRPSGRGRGAVGPYRAVPRAGQCPPLLGQPGVVGRAVLRGVPGSGPLLGPAVREEQLRAAGRAEGGWAQAGCAPR